MKNTAKLGLTVFLMLLFSSSIYAECSKGEVMKLIDKGFSKTEINSICDITHKTSKPKRKASKWITPKNSTCRSNGGKLLKGVCYAKWQDAKAICRASGGRLPSVHELIKVLTDCGGNKANTGNAHTENREDPNYQSCYKRKGFSESNFYWSSTTYANTSNYAWFVIFYDGRQSSYHDKTNSFYVRCVRAGQ